MKLRYEINNKLATFNVPDNTFFFRGNDENLSHKYSDITRSCNWYNSGFTIYSLKEYIDFEQLKSRLTQAIRDVISNTSKEISLEGFSLEKYHKYVDHKTHLNVIKKTRRLYSNDLKFDDKKVISIFEKLINLPLTYNLHGTDFKQWVIARINTPNSIGFNPAHKDIYEFFDRDNYIPQMINIWIPICGVNKSTGLAMVPGSHLLNENKIERTQAGSLFEGSKYSVNCIKSWDGENSMKLISPKEGSALIFSSHLIHGLGINNNNDETRVSLEFRLFKKN